MSPPHRFRRRLLAARAVVVTALALAACSGDGGNPTAISPSTTPAAASPAFARADVQVRAEDIDFPQRRFTTAPGEVTIGYVNEGRIFHTLVIEAGGDLLGEFSRLEVTKTGDVAVGTVRLDRGEYVLYCDVPGHRANGMEATLVVE